jgi:hypothetical protein
VPNGITRRQTRVVSMWLFLQHKTAPLTLASPEWDQEQRRQCMLAGLNSY